MATQYSTRCYFSYSVRLETGDPFRSQLMDQLHTWLWHTNLRSLAVYHLRPLMVHIGAVLDMASLQCRLRLLIYFGVVNEPLKYTLLQPTRIDWGRGEGKCDAEASLRRQEQTGNGTGDVNIDEINVYTKLSAGGPR